MLKYAIAVVEKNLDLIMFLNDGVRTQLVGEKPAFFLCEINGPREITATIVFEDELDEIAIADDKLTVLL